MENSRPVSVAAQLLFLLRFIQKGSIVLTGFVAIHFIYWHNRIHDPVPMELVIFVTTCSIAFLENYATSALSLHRQETKPNYGLLLKTSIPCSIAMAAGYYALRQVPFIRAWCEGDNDFVPRYRNGRFGVSGVEEHMCALTCVIIAAGAVALSFTLFVSVFAAVGLVGGKRGGFIELRGESDEYSDEPLPGLESLEKM